MWVWMMDRLQNRAKMSTIKIPLFSRHHHGDHVTCERANYKVLFEEEMPSWVNSHDCYQFLSTNDDAEIRLIWSNERSGFRHLYLMRFRLDEQSGDVISEVTQLTTGDWVVLDEGENF